MAPGRRKGKPKAAIGRPLAKFHSLTVGDVANRVGTDALLRIARPLPGTSAHGQHAFKYLDLIYTEGQRFGGEAPLLFESCILDPRAELHATRITFHGCFVREHGGLTAEVLVESRNGQFFALISSIDGMTISSEGSTLLRGRAESEFYASALALHLERTTGIGYDVEPEEVPGQGVGGSRQIDARLHPHNGAPPMNLQLTQANGLVAKHIGTSGGISEVKSNYKTLQNAVDEKAMKLRHIWTPQLKADTQLVLVSPIDLGPHWREDLRHYPPDARGFAGLWLCTPGEPPLRLR